MQSENALLMIEGCSATDLVNTYGSPLYVLSESKIRGQIQQIKDAFLNKYPNTVAAYASKAFLTTAFVKLIHQEGLSMDVVSGGELFTALHAGFPAEKLIFHGNSKSQSEIEMAVKSGVGRIVVDHAEELEMIETIASQYDKVMGIFFRITPGVEARTHAYISTGQKDSKFGIPLKEETFFPLMKKAIESPYIDFKGFHFHVGSQLFDNTAHIAATKVALSLIEAIQDKYNYKVTELNIGGGFGIQYTRDQEPKPLGYFLDPVMACIDNFCKEKGLERPRVYIEPGRMIVGEAGTTLYTVGAIKSIPEIRTYVAVDGGMTDNIRPALYGAQYEAAIATKMDAERDQTVTICGKCCESGDILIKDIQMPKIQSGDLLAIFSTGAYHYAMASHYNKQVIPAVVLVKGDQAYEIIKRESYEDLIQKDSVPDYLL